MNYIITIFVPYFREGDPLKFGKYYIEALSKDSQDELLESFDKTILILYLLPHIFPLSKEEAIIAVSNLIEKICFSVSEKHEDSFKTKKLFALSIALEALVYLKPGQCITRLLPPKVILPILLEFSSPKCIFILRALDFYVTVDELNLIVANYSDTIKNRLIPLLSSPYEKVRFFSFPLMGVKLVFWTTLT